MTAAAGRFAHAVPIASIGNDVVLVHQGLIIRADGKTLKPTGELRLPGRHPDVYAVAQTNGRMWLASYPDVDAHRMMLLAVNTTSWTFTDRVSVSSRPQPAAVTAAQGRVYVGLGRRIGVLRATSSGTFDRRIELPHPFSSVVALSVSPDGRSLYATVARRRNQGFPQLVLLDPNTGAVRAGPIDDEDGLGPVTATNDGVWMQTGGPHLDSLTFRTRDNLTVDAPGTASTDAGGGFNTSTTERQNTAWIGGTSEIACASPSTGRTRAAAPVGSPHHDQANLTRLTPTPAGLYGYYLADAGPSGYLVRLRPPSRCLPSHLDGVPVAALARQALEASRSWAVSHPRHVRVVRTTWGRVTPHARQYRNDRVYVVALDGRFYCLRHRCTISVPPSGLPLPTSKPKSAPVLHMNFTMAAHGDPSPGVFNSVRNHKRRLSALGRVISLQPYV